MTDDDVLVTPHKFAACDSYYWRFVRLEFVVVTECFDPNESEWREKRRESLTLDSKKIETAEAASAVNFVETLWEGVYIKTRSRLTGIVALFELRRNIGNGTPLYDSNNDVVLARDGEIGFRNTL